METVRIDQWLWAARMYKTRSVANQACSGGHVRVNGHSARPSAPVRVGDEVRVQREERQLVLEVAGLGTKRVSAPLARELYRDLSPPPPPREGRPADRPRGAGRPTKRDRRDLRRLRGRSG